MTYVSTSDREQFRNERNLAHYARDNLGRALSIKGITGTHALEVTRANTIKVELTPQEAHHLAHTLDEEAGE